MLSVVVSSHPSIPANADVLQANIPRPMIAGAARSVFIGGDAWLLSLTEPYRFA